MWGWQRQKKYAAAPEMPAACPSETMPMAKTRFAPFAVGENALGGGGAYPTCADLNMYCQRICSELVNY